MSKNKVIDMEKISGKVAELLTEELGIGNYIGYLNIVYDAPIAQNTYPNTFSTILRDVEASEEDYAANVTTMSASLSKDPLVVSSVLHNMASLLVNNVFPDGAVAKEMNKNVVVIVDTTKVN